MACLHGELRGRSSAVSDATGSDVALLDAFAAVQLGDWASASIGRFGSTVLWNAGVEERRLLFLDRSFLDEVWDGRDVGVELSGAIEQFNWWAAAQNGADGPAEELGLSARASYHLLGESLCGREGVQGLEPDEQHFTVGVGWFDDTSLDEGTVVGADLIFAKGRWSGVAEIVDFEDDIRPSPSINASTGTLIPSGSAANGAQTPWSATVGYLIASDAWEIAARLQDLDDDAETSVFSAAITWYVDGYDAKWMVQVDSSESDDGALEVGAIALGLTVGF